MFCNKATKDNTIFLSICDYERNSDAESSLLRRTAEKFGYEIRFCSYGTPFEGMYYSKIIKVLSYLQAIRDYKKYAFVLDCRDVVFLKHRDECLESFNDFYFGGVVYGANIRFDLWPLKKGYLAEAIAKYYGAKAGLCAGVYCGRISEICQQLEKIVRIRHALQKGRANDCTILKQLTEDPHYQTFDFGNHHQFEGKKLFDSEQFLVSVTQAYEDSLACIDVDKRIITTVNDKYPDLNREIEKESPFYVGTASILHSPWLTYRRNEKPNYDSYRDWVFQEILSK